jgi:PEP-CTERM motif-containing protein
LGLAVALGAASASATPVTYVFQSGAVTLEASSNGAQLSNPVNVALSGVAVTIDEFALTVNSLTFTVGSTGLINLLGAGYAGYTTFELDFATVSGTGGTLSLVDIGPPAQYGFGITLNLSGQFDAGPGPLPPAINNALFSIPAAAGAGDIFILGNQLFLNSITIGAIDPDGLGPLAPLLIKGDFVFVGIVPEPGTALLVGAGLLGLAARARRGAGPR